MTVFERMDEEFLKVLKELDSHSFEYVERVQDEKKICEMLERLLSYIQSNHLLQDKGIMCRAYYKKIEHMYYKFDVRVLKKKRVCYLFLFLKLVLKLHIPCNMLTFKLK
jgi:translation initiation factor 3 subunit C